jgi:hypothetical protein
MSSSAPLELTLLPGARELLAAHARELPQRDDLCGAFCAALALSAAGFEQRDGEPLDQDAVALAAGSTVSARADPRHLPHGEAGRRDYRLRLPFIEDAAVSGTAAAGLVNAIEALAGDVLAAIPFRGPWTETTLAGLFDALAALERPAALIANLATRHLWGGGPSMEQVLAYLLDGTDGGPPADWEVGHFVCVFGRLRGPGGSLYGIADTYPALGNGGVHLQPAQRLVRAIERRDMPAGGVIAVTTVDDAPAAREAAAVAGLSEGTWDNGSVIAAGHPVALPEAPRP